jgi:acyl-CoA reductase-like NAD-dependent aldehyde dehydrogenase
MFRTTHNSQGQPQTFFDPQLASKSAALQRTRGDLRTAEAQIEQMRAEWKKGDDWRRAALLELAYAGQDEHADAVAFKAGLEFLMKNRDATADQVAGAIDAAKKVAAKDRVLLDKSVNIQNTLRRRFF